jgi:hypothetical protein
MKYRLLIILMAFMPLLSSCSVVEYYEYVNVETASIKDCLWDTAYKKAKCLDGKDLVLIPDFRTFTPSFTDPYSRLIVCSKNDTPFWISKAILRVKGESTETLIEFNKEYPYKEAMGDSGYHVVWILLFDQKNTDYSKYEMKENLEFEVHYSPTKSGPSKSEVFQLNLKKRKDIAWPT